MRSSEPHRRMLEPMPHTSCLWGHYYVLRVFHVPHLSETHTHTLPEEPELRVERGMQRQKETRRKRVIDKDVSLGIDAAPSVFQWNQLGPPSPFG